MWKNLKLGPRFVVSLMIISLIPLAIISFTNYFYSKYQIEQRTRGNLQSVNESRVLHINHFVQLRQEQAKQLAGTYLIRQLHESGVNHPEVIRSIQDDIESVFYELKTKPRSDYKFIDRESDIANISVWDIHGNIIANTNRRLIGEKEPFTFLQILYEKGAYFKGFEKDPLTGEKYLTILEGIRNWDTDNYSGVVLLKAKAVLLNAITSDREGLPDRAETYIVDNEYRMITESRFVKDAVLNLKVNTAATRACFQGTKSPYLYKNYEGRLVLGVEKYLPDQGWCVVTETDAVEAFAPVRVFRNLILIIVGALLFLIMMFVNFSKHAILGPIMDLRNASLKIAKGNYDVAVPIKAKDELGELTEAFNIMARNLSAARAELAEKNKQLEEQKKLLEKVNQELDSFVYTASHDLRAPLRGIASFAEFLKEDYNSKLDAEGQDYVDEIQKGAKRLTTLIEDLLTLSRISRIKNPYESVKTGELVAEIVERIKFDVQEHKVDLKVQPDMPAVYCDRIKIGEVFLNLINNAIKFSSKNTKENPRVEVGWTDDSDVYKFFVRDNGIGIDPKFHDQIFGIFKRLHTEKEYAGSGAGLSIVKRVVDDHLGKVWVESQPGQGSTFFFTVPKNLKDASG